MSSTSVPSSKIQPQTREAGSCGRSVYRAVHWLVFLVALAGLVWGYLIEGAFTGLYIKPPEFSGLPARHVAMAQETVADFQPDFSRSFSEPLKRLVPHRTDGVVQPLWPWVVAWLMDAEGNVEVTGKDGGVANWPKQALSVQLFWTLGWLALLGIACARKFTLPGAILVVVLAGSEGFLPTVGPFTSEALFQVLFLLTWVACIFALQRNTLWVYGLVGGLGALTYLAEDRVLPLLIVFIVISTLRAIWEWLAAHFCTEEGTTQWVPRNHGFGLLLLGALFFFIAGPRLAESHERFGNAFFSYHDQVRWLDDAQAAEAWMKAHPASHSLEAKNPGELVQTYRQEHAGKVAWERLQKGLNGVWTDFGQHGGLALGLLLSLLILMALAMKWATPKAAHAGQRLHPETVPALLFMLAAAGTYFVIAAWDAPISGTVGRLSLLQAPMALGIVWGTERLLRRAHRRRTAPIFIASYHVLLWGLVGLESWRVIEGLQGPHFTP